MTLTLALALALSPEAAAWEQQTTNSGSPMEWGSSSYTTYVHPDLWADTSKRQDIQEVVAAINRNPSYFWMSAVEDDDRDTPSQNWESEVVETTTPGTVCGAPACAWTWSWVWGDTIESDVWIGDTGSLVTGTTRDDIGEYDDDETQRSYRTVLFHEFGHTTGLDHEDSVYNIMGQDWDHVHANGTVFDGYLGEDATAGLVSIYGSYPGSYYEDVSVSHWKHTGSAGDYSTHGRGQIYLDKAAGTQPWNDGTVDPYWVLNRGTTYTFELTLENSGASSQTVDFIVVASTNDLITTSDHELARYNSWTLSPNSPLESTVTITLPTTLAADTYHIGVVIDPDDKVSEVDETNNGTPLAEAFFW